MTCWSTLSCRPEAHGRHVAVLVPTFLVWAERPRLQSPHDARRAAGASQRRRLDSAQCARLAFSRPVPPTQSAKVKRKKFSRAPARMTTPTSAGFQGLIMIGKAEQALIAAEQPSP